jgi:hypothetical protein
VVKLAGAVVVCAIAAFVAAFYAAGAGTTTTKHITTHPKVVPFADAAAGGVATSFTGQPAPLKLPPPRHVKHHSTSAPVTAAPTVTSATTPSAPAPAPVYTPPPASKHKSKGGTGTGTTVVGP